VEINRAASETWWLRKDELITNSGTAGRRAEAGYGVCYRTQVRIGQIDLVFDWQISPHIRNHVHVHNVRFVKCQHIRSRVSKRNFEPECISSGNKILVMR